MKNIGSIISVSYALASDIDSISDPDSQGAVVVSFKPAKSFTSLAFSPETASYNEEQKDTDAGPVFEQRLSFQLPKVQTLLHLVMKSLADEQLVLKITDGNGTTVIMGSPDIPARGSWKVMRPAGAAGYNGYEVSFGLSSPDPAPFLNESFEVS